MKIFILKTIKDSCLCRKRKKFTGHRPTPRRRPLPRPGRTGGFTGSGTSRRISDQSGNGIGRNSPALSRTQRFFVQIINNIYQNNPLIIDFQRRNTGIKQFIVITHFFL